MVCKYALINLPITVHAQVKVDVLIVHVDYSNLWRTCEDINATWVSILTNLDSLVGKGKYGGPNRWNNPGEIHFSI